MLITNIKIENACEVTSVRIEHGIIQEIGSHIIKRENEEVIDGKGGLALPPFIDSHMHLDTCFSLNETGPNTSGTLFEGIRIWRKYRQSLTKEDIQKRALHTIQMYHTQGVQYLRSHVDISHDLTAFYALKELKDQVSNMMDIQLVAFPQDGIYTNETVQNNLIEAVQNGADAIGGIPHFELTRELGEKSIHFIMDLAKKYGCLVDMHCDEIDDEASHFLEILAYDAYASNLQDKVTASHTTAMHSYNNAYCDKLFRLLSMSKINIVANPLVNINLQGRFDSYPKRRGVTRIKELLENNINVSLGHDDIYDPFYPLGNGNMVEVLSMGLHACHMMAHQELMNSYEMITYNSAKTLHLSNDSYGIKVGNPANLNIFQENNFFEVLRKGNRISYMIRKGKVMKGEEV